MWLVVPLSVWLAQLYIFRCVHVSQLPQFKSVASDTVSESSRVPGTGFQVNVMCRRLDLSDLDYFTLLARRLLSFLFQREREKESPPQLR